MDTVLIEIVISATDAGQAGFQSRDEIEDPLDEAIERDGIGEITGGGAGSGIWGIDVEVPPGAEDRAMEYLRSFLLQLGVPASTKICERAGSNRVIVLGSR